MLQQQPPPQQFILQPIAPYAWAPCWPQPAQKHSSPGLCVAVPFELRGQLPSPQPAAQMSSMPPILVTRHGRCLWGAVQPTWHHHPRPAPAYAPCTERASATSASTYFRSVAIGFSSSTQPARTQTRHGENFPSATCTGVMPFRGAVRVGGQSLFCRCCQSPSSCLEQGDVKPTIGGADVVVLRRHLVQPGGRWDVFWEW